jgi:hypothetical protein
VRRALTLPALALTTALAVSTGLAVGGSSGALGATTHPSRTVALGSPGHWNKVSNGSVPSNYVPSVVRTSDGALHVVYAKNVMDGIRIGHTALNTAGTVTRRNDVLASGWSVLDTAPVVVRAADNSLRVLFGGMQSPNPGFWSQGRMYDATSTTLGADWDLPTETVGLSTHAVQSHGTAATTLADGTPVAGFSLDDTLTWHVGTDYSPDKQYQIRPIENCCMYGLTLVRDGDTVWAAWYQNGWYDTGSGTFAMEIYPTMGTPLKAPGSSVGSNSVSTGRVALAARAGGGVFAAYCIGAPTCKAVRIWKVGTDQTANVPGSKLATSIALSTARSGRLWLAWTNSTPAVRAMRTSTTGLGVGAVTKPGLPKHGLAYSIAIEGSRAKGDIVLNAGNGIWHTQVLPGLTTKTSKASWRAHHKQKVVFTVRDAKAPVAGAKVKIGSRHCKTNRKGTCAITFPASYAHGKHKGTVTKPHYGRAPIFVRVR